MRGVWLLTGGHIGAGGQVVLGYDGNVRLALVFIFGAVGQWLVGLGH